MKRLSDAVKRRIVEHLACYSTNAEIADLISNEFAVTVTPRHVRAYDPTSPQFAGSQRWLDYHQTVRERCAQAVGDVAIANRTYRMQQLQKILERALNRGDYRQALKTLEQAAKEMGNGYVRS